MEPYPAQNSEKQPMHTSIAGSGRGGFEDNTENMSSGGTAQCGHDGCGEDATCGGRDGRKTRCRNHIFSFMALVGVLSCAFKCDDRDSNMHVCDYHKHVSLSDLGAGNHAKKLQFMDKKSKHQHPGVKTRIYKKCPHDRRRDQCKECGGAGICPHKRQRNKCKNCGGVSICPHKRQRSECKECMGANICPHGRQRSTCKKCGGSGICHHGRRRQYCKECSPLGSPQSRLCITDCGSYRRAKCEGRCRWCFVRLYPDQQERRVKVKEVQLWWFLTDHIDKMYITYNKMLAGESKCVRIFPDFILTFPKHSMVIECDEEQHKRNTEECESRRIDNIHEAIQRELVVIRFNPDAYVNKQGDEIKSCFRRDDRLGYNVINPEMQEEWDHRLEVLLETLIRHKEPSAENACTTRTEIRLFYNGYDDSTPRKPNEKGVSASAEGTEAKLRKTLSWAD